MRQIATLGPSEKFSLAEDQASLSLQDGPRSGNIITGIAISSCCFEAAGAYSTNRLH